MHLFAAIALTVLAVGFAYSLSRDQVVKPLQRDRPVLRHQWRSSRAGLVDERGDIPLRNVLWPAALVLGVLLLVWGLKVLLVGSGSWW